MLLTVSLIVLIVSLFFSVLQWRANQKRHKLTERIPGPDGFFLFGVLPKFIDKPELVWKNLRQYATKYHPIYKFWIINKLVVNMLAPDDIEIILSSTKHSSKSEIYEILHPWLSEGLLTSAGIKWRNRRKILTPSFHFNILQQFMTTFVEQSDIFVKTLENECNKAVTNVTPLVAEFTLQTICETAMGTQVDMSNAKSMDYSNAITKLGEIMYYVLTHPWYKITSLFMLTPTYWEQKRLLNVLHGFTSSVIQKRKENFKMPQLSLDTFFTPKRRLALLDVLLSAMNSGEEIDDNGISEEVDTFMFEGHDTTTACICFTLLSLACHCDVQQKVYEELQEVFGYSDRKATYQDIQNLRYLEQVLKESLRMYPPVPFISRVTDEEIQTCNGYIIPKRTEINIHIYDVHHNPTLYPEPHKFDPQRFSPENCKARHAFAYIPFSAGPRNCIGQKFAYLEIKTVLSAILRKFVVEPIDKPTDLTFVVHFVLRTKNGVKMKFRRRD